MSINTNPFTNSQVLTSLLKFIDTDKGTPDTISAGDVKRFLDLTRPVLNRAPGFNNLSATLDVLIKAGGADLELPTASLGLVLAGQPPDADMIRKQLNPATNSPSRSILDMPTTNINNPDPVVTPANGDTYLVANGEQWSLEKSKAKMNETFAVYDVDKNGGLDAVEFKKYTAAKFGNLTDAEFKKLYDTINGVDEGVQTEGFDHKISTVSVRELGNFLYYADGQGEARVGKADGTVSKAEALTVIPPMVENETPIDRINARTAQYNLLEKTGSGVIKTMLGENAEAADSLKAETGSPQQLLVDVQKFTSGGSAVIDPILAKQQAGTPLTPEEETQLNAYKRQQLLLTAMSKEVALLEGKPGAVALTAEEQKLLDGYRAAKALDNAANPSGEKRSWDNARAGYLTNEAGVSKELSGGIADRSNVFGAAVLNFLKFLEAPVLPAAPAA